MSNFDKILVKLPLGSQSPLTPSPVLLGPSMSLKTGFLISLSEVMEDLMDLDKAGNGVKRLEEVYGIFCETSAKIKTLEPFKDYPFPLWPFMESWQRIKFDDLAYQLKLKLWPSENISRVLCHMQFLRYICENPLSLSGMYKNISLKHLNLSFSIFSIWDICILESTKLAK